MEDRTGTGLWLELVESQDTPYSERADELIDLPRVQRALGGEQTRIPDVPICLARSLSSRPSRYMRSERDSSRLRLHAIRLVFTSAGPTAGSGNHHGRSDDGILRAHQPEDVQMVPRALRDWADFVHIRHIAEAAVPGYTMITPYENAGGGDPRYLHLYEMDSADPESTFASMRPLVEKRLGRQGTPAFDEWAWHRELRIVYVNSFGRVGGHPLPIEVNLQLN